MARDADRWWWSFLGAFFLGALGPITFVVFFGGHLSSYDRLVKKHPQLLAADQWDEAAAVSFASARPRLKAGLVVYVLLLVVEGVAFGAMLAGG